MKAAEFRAKHMTEAELQSAITGALTANGWLWFHDHDSRRNRAGLPDIIAVHPRGLFIAVELKGPKTPVSKKQREWVDALGRFAARIPLSTFTGIVRPADWDTGNLREFIQQGTANAAK